MQPFHYGESLEIDISHVVTSHRTGAVCDVRCSSDQLPLIEPVFHRDDSQ